MVSAVLSNSLKRRQGERMKNIVLLVVALFGGYKDSTLAATTPEAIEFRSVVRGGFSGISEAKECAITNASEWAKLWTLHRPNPRVESKLPEIDFTKEMVVCVAAGRQRTGGYSVEIVKVQSHEGVIQIFTKRTAPRKGSIVTLALSAPFHFVALPRSDLKVEFREAEEAPK